MVAGTLRAINRRKWAEIEGIEGYGQTAPVADNRTDAGRVRNRRVELVKK